MKLNNLMRRTYHIYWVYILTNKARGTLYIGVTGGLEDRLERHRLGEGSLFTNTVKRLPRPKGSVLLSFVHRHTLNFDRRGVGDLEQVVKRIEEIVISLKD